ncbi:MAG: hypothetical protein PHN69_06120 [Candidatus Pacebacteria bacterium]|nr:hypothetical protein [Candidatus Paceibacterota bacterium]
MANCVIVQTRAQAMDVDALNRSVKSTTDMQNGAPLSLAFPTVAGSNVFTATTPASPFANVWLAYSPEVNKLEVGQIWGGNDPRNFTNLAGKEYDCFRPMAGTDIIQVTKEFFATGKDPGSVASSTVVELTASGFEAKTSATDAYAGISFKIGKKEPITIASSVGYEEQVDAWYLECTSNPTA